MDNCHFKQSESSVQQVSSQTAIDVRTELKQNKPNCHKSATKSSPNHCKQFSVLVVQSQQTVNQTYHAACNYYIYPNHICTLELNKQIFLSFWTT